MTAYRQRALACAARLCMGPARPRDLRAAAPDAGRILLRNVYGWFERIQPGLYRLSAHGEAAAQYWSATLPNALPARVIHGVGEIQIPGFRATEIGHQPLVDPVSVGDDPVRRGLGGRPRSNAQPGRLPKR